MTDGIENSSWAVEERWGDLSGTGFTVLPNTLIKAQAELELTANDIVVLCNLIMHWWKPDKMPFPRTSTIARRSGLSTRTIQRSVQKMQYQNYIEKVFVDDRSYFDLTGIKEKLVNVADEHAWTVERPRSRP